MDLNYLERSMSNIEDMLKTFRNEYDIKIENDDYISSIINNLIDSDYLVLVKNKNVFYLTYDDINPDISEISNDELSWIDSLPNNVEGSIKLINLSINVDNFLEQDFEISKNENIKKNCFKEYIFCDKISLIRIIEKILSEGYIPDYTVDNNDLN